MIFLTQIKTPPPRVDLSLRIVVKSALKTSALLISSLRHQKQHLSDRHFNIERDVQKIQRASVAITNNAKHSLGDKDTLIAEYDKGLNRLGSYTAFYDTA
jgi:predicted phage-related endonuclease